MEKDDLLQQAKKINLKNRDLQSQIEKKTRQTHMLEAQLQQRIMECRNAFRVAEDLTLDIAKPEQYLQGVTYVKKHQQIDKRNNMATLNRALSSPTATVVNATVNLTTPNTERISLSSIQAHTQVMTYLARKASLMPASYHVNLEQKPVARNRRPSIPIRIPNVIKRQLTLPEKLRKLILGLNAAPVQHLPITHRR